MKGIFFFTFHTMYLLKLANIIITADKLFHELHLVTTERHPNTHEFTFFIIAYYLLLFISESIVLNFN